MKPAPRPEPQAAFDVGISAESRAAAFLIAKGFRILARRWRSPLGEIDIVMRRRQLLVFAVVKARAGLDGAADSVNELQRRWISPPRMCGSQQIRTIRFAISASTRSWRRGAKLRTISRLLSKQTRRSDARRIGRPGLECG
ncbi:MAG: YraN family protein [Pseudolabrys sp.]